MEGGPLELANDLLLAHAGEHALLESEELVLRGLEELASGVRLDVVEVPRRRGPEPELIRDARRVRPARATSALLNMLPTRTRLEMFAAHRECPSRRE